MTVRISMYSYAFIATAFLMCGTAVLADDGPGALLEKADVGKFDPAKADKSKAPVVAKQDFTHPGMPALAALKAMNAAAPDKGLSRDLHDTQIYKAASPAVVLIATDEGLGTGSVIDKDGTILTNHHVVGDFDTVAVLFKPKQEGGTLNPGDAVEGKVIRVNVEKDLALVKIGAVPAGITPIPLGKLDDVQIGGDMHAIGHPTGEAWTYTKGIVSQVRADYAWGGEGRIKHKATVIQTQTPINPGNSGGPLLDDDGRMVGVNSFVRRDAEGINYAVSVADVEIFLKQTANVDAEKTPLSVPFKETKKCSEPQIIYEGPNYDNTADLQIIDTTCSGKANAEYVLSHNAKEPLILALFAGDYANSTVMYFDSQRRGAWEMSFWRENPKTPWKMQCYHDKGALQPARCEAYKPKK